MNLKKRALTFLLDLIFISSIILILIIARKQLQLYMDNLQNLSPQVSDLANILSSQNLTTYNQTYAEQIISQTNNLVFNTQIFLLLIPITMIIFYLITQSINWKIINKTKISLFLLSSIPFLAISLLFLNSLLDLLQTFLYEESTNLILTLSLFVLFIIITYFTLIFYIKGKIKFIKQAILPCFLILLNWFFILLNLILVYIFILTEQSILILLFPLIILLIIFNYQRTSFIKKVKSA